MVDSKLSIDPGRGKILTVTVLDLALGEWPMVSTQFIVTQWCSDTSSCLLR